MKRSITLACAFAFACTAFVALPAGETSAQTATNLKCKGCVGKKDLGKKAVRSKNIKPGAVVNEAIADGAVDAAKLADFAKPAGAAEASDFGGLAIINGITVVVSVSIDAPADGFAFVAASGVVKFEDGVGGEEVGICAVTDGLALDEDNAVATTVPDDTFGAISQTRVFPATKGTNTYRLICDTDAAADTLAIVNPAINALFVPTDISAP
jgi:hypothetical protein